jgi:hypothetical protein
MESKIIIKIDKIADGEMKYLTEIDGNFSYDDLMRVSMNLNLIMSQSMDAMLSEIIKTNKDELWMKRYNTNKKYMEDIKTAIQIDSRLNELLQITKVRKAQ